MDSVFIGRNGKATTLGRSQTFVLRARAQILTEIDLAGSAHARRTPLPPGRLYKAAWFQLVVSCYYRQCESKT